MRFKGSKNDRRNFLKTTGAGLAAVALPLTLIGQTDDEKVESNKESRGTQSAYLHGCGWNRTLPGVFGLACFSFEVRADIGGNGVGTIRDDVHSEVNSQFQIARAERIGRNGFKFQGPIISSNSPELIGMIVTIEAESLGNGQGRASITVESEGDNLVVIAIIAVIIGLLIPAVQGR